MRVTIIGINYAPEPTGIAPYTSELAEKLAAEGHSVQVITGYPHYPQWKVAPGYEGGQRSEVLQQVAVKRLRHHVPPSGAGLGRLILELTFGIRLVCARWSSPDIVIVVTPALFASAFAVVRARLSPSRVPCVIWVQDLYSKGLEETNRPFAASAMRLIERSVLRAGAGVVVIHNRFRRYVTEELGVSPRVTKVIRNWSRSMPREITNRESVRKQWGWRDDEIVALHAGNMGMKQGLENVVSAAAMSDDSQANVRFVLMGDGNQRSRLQTLSTGVRSLQLIDPVPGDRFEEMLCAADVLIVNELPGAREMAVPSKLTAYFAAGRAIVAATESDSTTAAEIEASGAGIRVDPASPADLLQSVERLGRDKELSANFAASGVRYSKKVLGKDAATAEYAAFLQEVLVSSSFSSNNRNNEKTGGLR